MKNEKNIFKNKKWLFVSATVLSIASLSAIHPQDAKAATTTSGKDPEQGQVTDTKNNKNNVKNAKTSINFIAQKQVKTSAPINYAVKPDVTNTQSKDNVTTNEVNSQAPQDNTQNNKNSSQADQSVTPAVQAANTIKATYEEDPTTGKETASIPGASLSINHNKLDLIDDPNAGTINITFTVNSANAGDTFTINVPQDYGYTIGQMTGVGSLSVNQSNNNGTITITANSNINGAVILNAVITEANNSYRSAPTTPIDKLGTITQEITWSKNNTPIDKNLKFILYEDPASIVNINPIKGPDTNNGAIMANTDGVFTLNINGAVGLVKNDPNYTNWVYSGTNYGTTVTIPVPKGFILNQSLTKLYNNPKYYGTVTQEGDKLIVTVPKGTGTENYEGYPGLRIVGKFDVSAPDETETITADGNPTVSQNILYTNADGTTTMHTVTKSTTPWTVTILGDNPKNNSSVSVTGAQNNNQLILDPGATVDPNPAIVNTVGFTNGSGLDLDNNNLPADQQAQLNITIPDGLVVNKISTPTSAMYLPGTTSYTYTLTLANGKTISGTVKAGDDIVNNNGVPIIKVVITPDYLSALATNVNNNKFQLYGKLSDTYYNGKDIKNGDTLSTTAEFNYSYYDNKNDKTMFEYSTGDDTQTVTGYTRGFSKEGIFSANGDSTYFGSDPIIAQAGQKINTGIFSTSQGNHDTVDEPIFYYVLPTDTYADIDVDNVASNFSNNSLIEGNVPPPKISTYLSKDGLHQVVKLDYTGTGTSVPTKGSAYNRLIYTINLDALPGAYSGNKGGQIYVVSSQELLVGNGAEVAATQNQIDIYLQGNPTKQNAYYIGSFSNTVTSGQALDIHELSQGNNDPLAVNNATSTDKNSPDMSIDFNLVNTASDTTGEKMVAIENVPSIGDQYGDQFDFTLTGKATYVPQDGSVPEYDVQILYSTTACPEPTSQDLGTMPDLSSYVTADKITDWSTVKSVAEVIANGLPINSTAGRVVLHGKDNTQIYDAGKKVYAQAMLFGVDIKPVINSVNTNPGITNITIDGDSTINVKFQYDYNGQTYMTNAVPGLAKKYQDNSSVMNQSDFENLPQSQIEQALIANGVPENIAQYFKQSKQMFIANGTDASWKAYWPDAANGTAAFGQTVKYYFDGDTVIIQLDHDTRNVTEDTTKTVTRTINVTNPDGQTTPELQTITFTRTATEDQVTGKITYSNWTPSGPTEILPEYSVPSIPGYTPEYTTGTTESGLNVGDPVAGGKVGSLTIDPTSKDYANEKTTITVNIDYKADPQTATVQFVDQTDNSKVLSSTTLNGVTAGSIDLSGQDAQLKTYLSEGYGLATDNPDVATGVLKAATFGNGQSPQVITIKLVHKTVTVDYNSPKPSQDKLPDNSNLTYPDDVNTDNLNKTVERIVTIDGQQTTQTVKFGRNATVDEVTGKVTGYTNWETADGTSADLGSVTVTPKAGYTPVYTDGTDESGLTVGNTVTGNTVDALTINPNDYKDPSTTIHVNVSYKADPQTATVNFVDNTDNKSLNTITINGVTDGTVDLANANKQLSDYLSEGYKLDTTNPDIVDGTIKSMTYGTDPKNPVSETVYLVHKTTTVHYNDPKTSQDKLPDNPGMNYPGDVNTDNLTKTVIRDVTVVKPDGSTTTTQEVEFGRDATVDEVTGRVTKYSDWQIVSGNAAFDTVSVPPMTGYTPKYITVVNESGLQAGDPVANDEVNALTIDPNASQYSGSKTQISIVVSYEANDQSTKIQYVTSDGSQAKLPNGTNVPDVTVNGKTGKNVPVDVNSGIPDNWELVPNQNLPKDITFGPNGYPVIKVEIQHKTKDVTTDPSQQDKVTHTVTRTINVNKPNEPVQTITQTVTYNRTATKDLVTGDITYSDWTTKDNQLSEYDAPTVDGYTPSQTTVPEVTTTPDTADSTVNITYTANDQSTNIQYVTSSGSPISEVPVTGKTDETVPVTNEINNNIPKNWKLVPNQDLPKDIKFGPKDNPVIKVVIEHQTEDVTKEQNPSDVTKTITRTINVNEPGKAVQTITQTVTYNRTATKDLVTDGITYGDWTTKDNKLLEYDAPTVTGYTPNQETVPEVATTADTKDSTVNITYTANDQSTNIQYETADGQPATQPDGSAIPDVTVTGKTDETVPVNINKGIPDGWELVPGQSIPDTITFGSDGHANIPVKIQHKTTTVSYGDPKTDQDKLPDNPSLNYPDGVTQNDLNKTVTRNVTVTLPGNIKIPTTQNVKFGRSATIDEVTGKVISYSDWKTVDNTSANLGPVTVPNIPGYTPKYSDGTDESGLTIGTPVTNNTVGSITINPNDYKDPSTTINVNVSYTANDQSTKIQYETSDGKPATEPDGSAIPEVTVTGKTDQNVPVTNDINTGIPKNWELVPNQSIPDTITFGPDGHANIIVKIQHKTEDVTTDPSQQGKVTKTIIRTINVTEPGKPVQTITQTVTYNRTATKDLVTGDITYSDWTTKDNQLPEYDAPTVDGYTPSQTKVSAENTTADTSDSTVNITYSPEEQKATVTFVDQTTGDVLTTDNLTGVTAGKIDLTNADVQLKDYLSKGYELATYNPDIVDGTIKSMTYDDDTNVTQTATIYLVHKQDTKTESKTITRTINVTEPITGKVTTTTQPVTITREVTTDEVTHKVISSTDWTTKMQPEFTAPTVAGYTPSQQTVPAVTVDGNSTDTTVNITYTANDQHMEIQYVTSDGKPATKPDGSPIKDVTVDGKTDQQVVVTDDINKGIPAGWELVPNQGLPDTITFGPNGHDNTKVEIQHKIDSKDVSYTGHETVTYNTYDRNGDLVDTTKSDQTVNIKGIESTDEVTGKVTYTFDNPSSTYKEIKVPVKDGYYADKATVPEQTVTINAANPQDNDLNISATVDYKPMGQIVQVGPDGKQIPGTTPVTYPNDPNDPTKAGQVTVPNPPTGWVLSNNSNGGTFTPSDPGTYTEVEYEKLYEVAGNSKDVTRTIEYIDSTTGKAIPSNLAPTVNQTVTLKNYEVKDADGKVIGYNTSGKWENGKYIPSTESNGQIKVDTTDANASWLNPDGKSFIEVTSPDLTKDGYSVPSQATVPEEAVNGESKDSTIKVTYSENTITVDPNDPKTSNDIISGTNKHYPSGVSKDDLNKTITRTITVTSPDGKITTIPQKVTYTRNATVNEVTGKVTYGDWTTADKTWPEYKVPTVPGYTPSQNNVPAEDTTSDTADSTVNITYTANDQSTKIQYVTSDGTTISEIPVTGKTDETVPVTNEINNNVPKNWKLVPNQDLPTNIKFGPKDNPVIKVVVEHKTEDVTKDPSLQDEVNKTITRTIIVTKPNGEILPPIQQKVIYTRTATKDLVTGGITYSDWTTSNKTWPAYDAPTVNGYTPSQETVPAENTSVDTKDSTVNITYTANDQSTNIHYETADGKPIADIPVNGKTGETVKVTDDINKGIPDGWELVPHQDLPKDITFGPDGHADISVKIQHKTENVTGDPSQKDEVTKTITRTITVEGSDGIKNVKQTVTFTRKATKDLVTGTITYSPWDKASQTIPAYVPEAIPGYRVEIISGSIDAIPVTPDSKDTEAKIEYVLVEPTNPGGNQTPDQNKPSGNNNTGKPTTDNNNQNGNQHKPGSDQNHHNGGQHSINPSNPNSEQHNNHPSVDHNSPIVEQPEITKTTNSSNSERVTYRFKTRRVDRLPQTGSARSGLMGVIGMILSELGLLSLFGLDRDKNKHKKD